MSKASTIPRPGPFGWLGEKKKKREERKKRAVLLCRLGKDQCTWLSKWEEEEKKGKLCIVRIVWETGA